MNELVYPRERTLGLITLVLGIMVWIVIVVGTIGMAFMGLLVGFVFYLFAQSALIAHIKGNGVELTESQFPDLYKHFVFCCGRLEMSERPSAYILNGNGGLNAFATKFLKSHFVVLLSDVVDAMDGDSDGIRFYIGHELGHIKRKHIRGNLLRWPVLWLPLIGAAYSRSRESTCDLHGRACCESPAGAAKSLAALSAGSRRWKDIDITAYIKQSRYSSGFWMSLHELLSGYPWITKRVSRVMDPKSKGPSRNGFSYLFAVFVPYAGRMGSGFGLLIFVYIIGIIAAIAIPQFHNYKVRAQVTSAIIETQPIQERLAEYYLSTEDIPTLEQLGVGNSLSDGSQLSVDPDNMVLEIKMEAGEVYMIPSIDEQGYITWQCLAGEGMQAAQLPDYCK